MQNPIIMWVAAAAVLLQSGWVLALETRLGPPPSENKWGNLGTIGIVSARYAPTFKFRVDAGEKGSGAGKGTLRAVGGFWGGCGEFAGATADSGLGILAIVGCAYLTPFVAAGGAAFGALKANRGRGGKLKKTKSAMKPVLTERGIQVVLQDHVVRQTRARTNYTFVPRWDIGPNGRGQPVNYANLADQGIDTILEVSVTKVRAMGEAADPTLAMTVIAHARLIRVSDGTELYSHKYAFRSDRRELTEWAAGDPALRRLSEQACTNLAERIVSGVFLLDPPSRAAPESDAEEAMAATRNTDEDLQPARHRLETSDQGPTVLTAANMRL
ncbi:MAG: hypothetical protein ACE5H7_08500 [Acidiferrobacterales bacterium]